MYTKVSALPCEAEQEVRAILRRLLDLRRWKDYSFSIKPVTREGDDLYSNVEFKIRAVAEFLCDNSAEGQEYRTFIIKAICRVAHNVYDSHDRWDVKTMKLKILGNEINLALHEVGAITLIEVNNDLQFIGDEVAKEADGETVDHIIKMIQSTLGIVTR